MIVEEPAESTGLQPFQARSAHLNHTHEHAIVMCVFPQQRMQWGFSSALDSRPGPYRFGPAVPRLSAPVGAPVGAPDGPPGRVCIFWRAPVAPRAPVGAPVGAPAPVGTPVGPPTGSTVGAPFN